MLFGEDVTRYKIFMAIIRSRKMITLSEISSKLKITPQSVAYHMPFLERTGLVIRSDGLYFCQPILVDESVRRTFSEKMTQLVESMADTENEIIVPDGDIVGRGEIFVNCLKALLMLNVPEISEGS